LLCFAVLCYAALCYVQAVAVDAAVREQLELCGIRAPAGAADAELGGALHSTALHSRE
jgi:hypothetical protein